MKQVVLISSSISFVVGALLSFFIIRATPAKQVGKSAENSKIQEIRVSGYKFISPLLECEVGGGSKLNALDMLQSKVRAQIEEEKSAGNVTEAAIYFRELNNGPAFGVNQDLDFAPASLLKTPVMMAYFKLYDDSIEQLDIKKIKYEEDVILLDQDIKPEQTLQKGKEYSITELIEKMMIFSDNASLAVLERNIDHMLVDQVTLDLGIETAGSHTPDDYMSVRGYATLFRVLYNASYLEKDMSERALEILSRSTFNNGIVAGLPAGIKVSHKFGERELDNGITQLHDCGIVYYPNNPYLICIMTRGTNITRSATTIAQLSSTTFHGIEEYIAK